MLYDVLKNRASVNILKQLSENELKKDYTTKVSELKGSQREIADAVAILASEKLIYNEDSLLSISEKGKKFIEAFDRLVELFKAQQEQSTKNIEIQYNLSDFEKKILFVLFKVHKETGEDILLSSLTQELFPYEDVSRRKLRVSRELSKLEQLNLVNKAKKERNVFVQITDSGLKVVKRQIVTEVKKVL